MIWMVIFVITLIAEAMTVALISIWFSIGAVFAFIAEKMGFGLPTQIFVFILLSFLLLLVTKPFVKKVLIKKIEPTNVHSLIGQTAKVITHINNLEEIGEVKLGHVIYMARNVENGDIRVGETVIVERIEGVKVFVRKHEATPLNNLENRKEQ